MKKKLIIGLLILSLIAVPLFAAACEEEVTPSGGEEEEVVTPSDGEEEEVFEFTLVSDAYNATHPAVTGAIMPWIEEIEEQSGGRISITFYAPDELVPDGEGYDSCVSGICDFVAGMCSETPGKFPLDSVLALPFLVPSGEAGTYVLEELPKIYPEWNEQYEGTKLLWQWTGSITQLHTTDKLVETLEDLQGMQIIAVVADTLDNLALLGVNTVEVTATEVYTSLERNMAEGVIFPFAAIQSLKVVDVSSYHTFLNMEVGSFYMAMNIDSYNSLPSDLQEIIEESCAGMAVTTNSALVGVEESIIATLEERGDEFASFSAADRQAMIDLLESRYDAWVEDMEALGYSNARQIMEDAVRLGNEYTE